MLGKRMCMLRSGCDPSGCNVEPFFNMYMKKYKEYGQCTKNTNCKSNVCKVGYCCKQEVNDACLMCRLNQLPPYHNPLKTPLIQVNEKICQRCIPSSGKRKNVTSHACHLFFRRSPIQPITHITSHAQGHVSPIQPLTHRGMCLHHIASHARSPVQPLTHRVMSRLCAQ